MTLGAQAGPSDVGSGKILARAVGRNQRDSLCDLGACNASTLRSRRCSGRSVLRLWSPQNTRSHCLVMTCLISTQG